MSSVETWLEHFKTQQAAPAVTGIDWLDAQRQRAIDRFASKGWPGNREAKWRHTSLAPLQQQTFALDGEKASADQIKAVVDALKTEDEGRFLVFVNGHYEAGLSDSSALPKGVTIKPLSEALLAHEDVIQSAWGDEQAGHTVQALNLALARDGAFIYLRRGAALEQPVHLVFVQAQGGAPAFPRNLIVAEQGSIATIVEHYVSAFPKDAEVAPSLTNAVTRLQIHRDANITHMKTQEERDNAFHLAAIMAEQAEHSVFNSHSLSFGARLARNDIHTVFNGPHCETLFNGLYHTDARRHVDHNTLIRHDQPHCVSHEYYRGIMADMGRGVFEGRIVVAEGADGTDSMQRSDSLLLSKLARADSKPELEIYADDVACAHGATVGQLDEDALFYLQTRGLDEAYARNVMTYAFAAEAIQRIALPGLRKRASQAILNRLPGGELLGDME